jgi:hypothetical protein
MEPKTRIVVEIDVFGVAGCRDLLKQLIAATAEDEVQWKVEEVEGGEPTQSATEIIVGAVVGKVAEQVVEKVEAVVGPWCRSGMNRVWHRIRIEPVEAGAGTATDAETGTGTGTGTDADTDTDTNIDN